MPPTWIILYQQVAADRVYKISWLKYKNKNKK